MITRILIVVLFFALSTAAQAECRRQTAMSPWGECGKAWPKGDRLAESGFPNGLQGHCWGCMHGCTPENDAKICGWNADAFPVVKQSQEAPAVALQNDDARELARINQIIKDFGSTECFKTGMPKDCDGWVGGPFGWTKPTERQ